MTNTRLYVDFHVLQTVPPSCVNRDDTGSPKTAIYGGVTRARVSSQAWKHAMREMFREELLDRQEVGERTKKVSQLIADEIETIAPGQDAKALAKKVLNKLGLLKMSEKEEDLDVLVFLSHEQARGLAKLAVEGCSNKKALQAALREHPSVDMVLFGRMVIPKKNKNKMENSTLFLNYDAAAQVAHSISTHRVQNEYDYFTAVDDCAPEDNAGAGHLGTVEYNSSTLYRYATVNVVELAKHLGSEAAAKTVRVFAEAFIRSMPTGKQNTFANRTLPDLVYVTVRDDQPVNLCGAFEQAVLPAQAGGYVTPSKERLASHAKDVYASYTGDPLCAFAIGRGLEDLAETVSMKDLLPALEQKMTACLSRNEVE